MSILIKVRNVCIHPILFWESVKNERGMRDSITHFCTVSVCAILFYTFYAVYVQQDTTTEAASYFTNLSQNTGLPMVLVVGGIIALSYIMYFLGSIMNACSIHFISKKIKGSGTFAETVKALMYGSTPLLLLVHIPMIGSIAPFYSAFLQITGLQKLHRLSWNKALLAYIIGGLLLLIAIITITFIIVLLSIFLWP